MRVFIAVEVNPEVQQRIATVIERLQSFSEPVRWAKEGAMHLTIKFIGEFPEERLDSLKETASKAIEDVRPCTVEFRGTGLFPNERKARVLWVGVNDVDGELQRAHKLLEDSLKKFSIKKENHPFKPHLTLGRVRVPGKAPRTVKALLSHSKELFGRQEVTELVLFQSLLSPSGATYNPLAYFPLKADES